MRGNRKNWGVDVSGEFHVTAKGNQANLSGEATPAEVHQSKRQENRRALGDVGSDDNQASLSAAKVAVSFE
jgi:hypothetical protein